MEIFAEAYRHYDQLNYLSQNFVKGMRRTGKTTRMVDEAVQALFTYEKIIVPSLDGKTRAIDMYDRNQIFIDPDAIETNNAQKHLRDRIIDRVEREHKHLQVTKTGDGELTLISRNFGR